VARLLFLRRRQALSLTHPLTHSLSLYIYVSLCAFFRRRQARFLLSKVNPSSTHTSGGGGYGGGGGGGGEVIQTDDVSFQTFMEYLQRLTVQS
jgi:hypothetical protein